MNLGRERLIADRPVPPRRLQGRDLLDIAQPVALRHQHPVRVAHFTDTDLLIHHARDVDDPGMLGEQRSTVGECVVERVMHQLEPTLAAHRLDSVDRFRLVA